LSLLDDEILYELAFICFEIAAMDHLVMDD